MAFRQVGRGSLKLQLPGGQISWLIWKNNTGGFTATSSIEALSRRFTQASLTPCIKPRKQVAMLFLLCPICLKSLCRVLYRLPGEKWSCRACAKINYSPRYENRNYLWPKCLRKSQKEAARGIKTFRHRDSMTIPQGRGSSKHRQQALFLRILALSLLSEAEQLNLNQARLGGTDHAMIDRRLITTAKEIERRTRWSVE